MATHNVSSPILGTVFKITVKPGDTVRANREILILESMKMEHPVEAGVEGTIAAVLVTEGDTISAGQVLVHITQAQLQMSLPLRIQMWLQLVSVPTLLDTAIVDT